MTEKRKVMFKSYDPLTFIQTDKPIYIPGQTARETRKTQRLKDLQPSHPAKASKKMDAFVNRPLEDTTAVSGAVAGEPTLAFHASEMRAIRVSTQNIEQDTKEIKATVEDIEGKISTLNSRIDEAEERVAALEGTAHTSKQRIEAIQEEMRKLMDHIDDLDNRGRRCNLKILGIPELKEGDDMIQFLQREIPEMLGHRFPTLEIQRAHRVPTGPPRRDQREGNRPRPVMVNLLRYQVKEEMLRRAREKGQILWQVNFRVVTMDANFVPLKQEVREYSVLTLEDNKGNRIGQWTNVSSGLIVQLSHKLNPEAPEGMYNLKANIGDRSISHSFKVKKYVLPRFEITVKAPKSQSVGEEELKITVCGKYTYGQPVPGDALVHVCRKPRHWKDIMISPCVDETMKMEENGCASPVFNISAFIGSKFKRLKESLDVTVTLTEEGTDISMEKTKSIDIDYQIGKVEFLDLPKYFERNTVIEGKIKVSTFNGKPVPDKKVYLSEGYIWSGRPALNLTTDINGLANFTVNAPDHPQTQISLRASVYPGNQYIDSNKPFYRRSVANIQVLHPATPHSPVHSELSIETLEEPLRCGAEISINVKYYIVGETTENYSIDVVHMVLSKGAIVHHGYEKVEVKESKKLIEGKVSFKLSVDAELAPVVQVLVYCVLPSKNIIAASRNFNVEKCFRNKVSLQFSPSEAVPGEDNSLQLSALPGSLCGVSAVDQSVFILEPGPRLNADKVTFTLTELVRDTVVWCQTSHSPEDVVNSDTVRRVTQVNYRPVETVRKFFPETWIWQLAEVGDSGSAQIPITVPDTITTWETEAFCLSPRGLGVAAPAQLRVFQPFFLELSLPYSIIRGEEFELKATVFNYLSKCIMVKVTPAPSPHYTLKASSDGEYSSCLCANGRKTFKWTLVPSVLGVLNVTVSAEAEQSQAVCDNEIVSVPERGRIDTVTRSLLVQAEGTEKTKSQSWLLCPQGSSVSEELELLLPEDVIEGSARASVSVLGKTGLTVVGSVAAVLDSDAGHEDALYGASVQVGEESKLPEPLQEEEALMDRSHYFVGIEWPGDILGRALKNIDGLLKMPYGCGEQNIALLAPNIYILQYLENTEQLTAAIRERASGFLRSGYQRQLNYKHVDGAYSTFGKGDGNTWLTAFVLRTFGKAQRYIFIDPQNINSAKRWLINKQRADGCFITQGKLFNNRMKGGVNDDVTMTAYITASLLELGDTVKDPVVSKGLSCLKSSIGILNTYATALLAYTFSLAGEKDTRVQLFKKLNSVALSEDDRLHWSQSASDDSDSLAVEISSYVLLAVLTTSEVTAADLGYANRIVSWLVRQQNPYGGFSSTQDTVVALQALALYSTKVFSSDGSSTVTVHSADGDSHSFDVNESNKLLYQEKPLRDVPGKYSMTVKGSTCVSVQMALFYNVPTPSEANTLRIKAKVDGNCSKSFGYTLSIKFTVSSNLRYVGELNSTNMVLVDIKILSGFTADPGALKDRPLVERVDTKDDHVIMYLKEVPRDRPMSYQLHLKQVLPVKNLKPAVIKVYDYYQTSKSLLVYMILTVTVIILLLFTEYKLLFHSGDQSETEYSSPCV
ncbi:hypothetical protein NFI96_029753 [Prochilodus magdalenae]|nr:hypothetical protein NFI96_029753 [Prochilodus magdalenae]